MKNEYIIKASGYYYSNCLVEAIKAKLRNPDVKIIKRRIHGAVLPHYLWKSGEWIYDFGTDHAIITPLLFRGCLRKRRCVQ